MLFVSVVCAACVARLVPAARTDKNADLLEVIKLNLRKNNDDYGDGSIVNKTANNAAAASSRPARAPGDVPNEHVNVKGARRANDGGFIDSAIIDNILDFGFTPAKNKTNVGSRKNAILNRLKGNQLIRPIERKVISRAPLSVTSAITPTLSTHKKTSNSHDRQLEKVRKFYEKNKHLLKEFLSSKIAARTSSAPRRAVAAPSSGAQLRQRAQVRKVKGVLSRGQNWLGEEDNVTEPPNPDLLDMMPAIGGRIHFRRIEGRLCHRHVIIPEGPKYDSKGRVYLAAHADKVKRPYNVTRRPSLLLPKCCNCCKKSVLGCE